MWGFFGDLSWKTKSNNNGSLPCVAGFFFGRTPLIKVRTSHHVWLCRVHIVNSVTLFLLQLSPKKMWEGFIGGGVATVIYSMAGWYVHIFFIYSIPSPCNVLPTEKYYFCYNYHESLSLIYCACNVRVRHVPRNLYWSVFCLPSGLLFHLPVSVLCLPNWGELAETLLPMIIESPNLETCIKEWRQWEFLAWYKVIFPTLWTIIYLECF